MKNRRIFISIIIFFMAHVVYGQQTLNTRETLKSIAIILKINGDQNHITSTEIFKSTVYKGKAKRLNESRHPKASGILKIKAFDETENMVFDGYFENPLYQHLESFEENGPVNNNLIPATSGYINIRFPLAGNVHGLVLKCYMIKNNEEILVSTNSLNVQ